jgi:hypothetical protein
LTYRRCFSSAGNPDNRRAAEEEIIVQAHGSNGSAVRETARETTDPDTEEGLEAEPAHENEKETSHPRAGVNGERARGAVYIWGESLGRATGNDGDALPRWRGGDASPAGPAAAAVFGGKASKGRIASRESGRQG